MHLTQGTLGNVDRGVIAPGSDGAIGAIMLGDRRQRIRRREVGTLKPKHLGLRNARTDPVTFLG